MSRGGFKPEEVESIYVDPRERFVVSLIVGYADEHLKDETFKPGDELEMDYDELLDEDKAKVAARAALSLTTDYGLTDTRWFVFDRDAGTMYSFEQGDFMPKEDHW